MFRRAIAVAAASTLLALTVGCSSLSRIAKSTAARAEASEKSEKDIAACEKMCAVAGDADDNKAAVENCQKKCRQ